MLVFMSSHRILTDAKPSRYVAVRLARDHGFVDRRAVGMTANCTDARHLRHLADWTADPWIVSVKQVDMVGIAFSQQPAQPARPGSVDRRDHLSIAVVNGHAFAGG